MERIIHSGDLFLLVMIMILDNFRKNGADPILDQDKEEITCLSVYITMSPT